MDADVIVVGAGISGALVADRLAAAGVSVLILEAGPRIDRAQAVTRFFDALVKVPECAYPNTAYAPHPRSDDLDFYYVQSGPDKFSSTYVRQVGGTTWHWLGTCLRLVPDDFRLATRFSRGIDWPIDYRALEPWYGAAENAIGVAGDSDVPGPLDAAGPQFGAPRRSAALLRQQQLHSRVPDPGQVRRDRPRRSRGEGRRETDRTVDRPPDRSRPRRQGRGG